MPSRSAILHFKGEVKVAMEDKEDLEAKLGETASSEVVNEKIDPKLMSEYAEWSKKSAPASDVVLMREFSNPALLRDVKMVNIQFDKGSSKGKYDAHNFTMTLYGAFSSISSYLAKLEEMPIMLVLNSVNISDSGEESGRVNADIEGVVYGK